MMDVVYTKNPNIPLCIINSCYYREKYGFGLSLKLCEWIFNNYFSLTSNLKAEINFDKVQKQHFSRGVISYNDLKDFVLLCYRHYKIGVPIFPKFM